MSILRAGPAEVALPAITGRQVTVTGANHRHKRDRAGRYLELPLNVRRYPYPERWKLDVVRVERRG